MKTLGHLVRYFLIGFAGLSIFMFIAATMLRSLVFLLTHDPLDFMGWVGVVFAALVVISICIALGAEYESANRRTKT